MATPSDPTAAVLDASAMVAWCAREAGRDAVVERFFDAAAAASKPVYAPGAIVSECLYVFCKKLAAGQLDAASHALAVRRLDEAMLLVSPPPDGDRSLVIRANRLAAGYACPKSTDSVYLALAEALAAGGEVVEVVTFDEGQAKRADRIDGVVGRYLPAPPAPPAP